MKLDHVALAVTNIEKSLAFYSLLGFKKIESFARDDYRAVFIGTKELNIELFESTNIQNDNWKYHFCLIVEDLDKTVKDLKLKGIEIENIKTGITVKKYCFFKDIDGNNIELCER